ncbi:hypothetical protein N801_04650 [Knoellia aerolata DSM 18566]|uniref:Uncharacterized protein n=1 Tax=Knoellia aerolata DSM 18566 TaxID=1385519 RepID=A0A0A0K0G1_9MICO|nr:hypothetical protein N801_04650 [Knoellia aerolata DSM 18566]
MKDRPGLRQDCQCLSHSLFAFCASSPSASRGITQRRELLGLAIRTSPTDSHQCPTPAPASVTSTMG